MSAPQPPRCPLARMITEPMDTDSVKREGWQQHGILVVALDDDRLGMIDREFIRILGERLYGAHRTR